LAEINEQGSLRAAATTLSLTQPALSKALRELEDMLGLQLFARTSRGLARTAQGEALTHGAQLLINELDHIRAEAHAAGPKGRASALLRLGAPQFVAVSLLPSVIRSLVAYDPPIIVTLREGSVPQLFRALIDGSLDALLTVYTPESHAVDPPEALRYEKIADEDYAVAAHASHPLAHSRQVSWQRLANEAWILMLRPSLNRLLVEQSFLRAGVAPPAPVVESDNPVTNIRLAAQGIGLTLAPGRMMREAERAGGVRRIRVRPGIPTTALSLVYRASATAHPRISSLRDALLSLGPILAR
jgi:DNA-binding transcriptional LysR family regulator